MKIYKDVVYLLGAGQGSPTIVKATPVTKNCGVVFYAKGKKPSQTVISSQGPWEPQQQYLTAGFGQARAQFDNNKLNYYPGQTYASFSPQTERALNLTEQRALAGSPIQNMANQQLMSTIQGDYLYGGPGFDAAFNAAANKIIPQVQSGFNRGGRLNSGLARQAETSALADAFANQYSQERQNQLRSMEYAPQAAQADYNDLKALAAVGQQREGQTQSAIDEAMARHDYNQNAPWELLARYMNAIQGTYGGEELRQGFEARNKGAGVLGGALGGGYLGSQIGGPWGGAIGGVLGGLGGLF